MMTAPNRTARLSMQRADPPRVSVSGAGHADTAHGVHIGRPSRTTRNGNRRSGRCRVAPTLQGARLVKQRPRELSCFRSRTCHRSSGEMGVALPLADFQNLRRFGEQSDPSGHQDPTRVLDRLLWSELNDADASRYWAAVVYSDTSIRLLSGSRK